MSRNTMSPTEEREYADWILELRQQATYAKRKHANEHWHRIAERLATAFGAGDPDSGHSRSGPRVSPLAAAVPSAPSAPRRG